MFLFLEREIRRGLNQVCGKIRTTGNNQYRNNCDPKPKTFLIYNDVKNKYGWEM